MSFRPDGTLYDRDASIRRVVELQFEAFRPELPAVSKTPLHRAAARIDGGHGHNRPLGCIRAGTGAGLRRECGGPARGRFQVELFSVMPSLPGHFANAGRASRSAGRRSVSSPTGQHTGSKASWTHGACFAIRHDSDLRDRRRSAADPIFARALERCGVRASGVHLRRGPSARRHRRSEGGRAAAGVEACTLLEGSRRRIECASELREILPFATSAVANLNKRHHGGTSGRDVLISVRPAPVTSAVLVG